MAFHPDFADPDADGYGRFYTHTSEPYDDHAPAEFSLQMPDGVPPNHIGVISEWRVDDHTTNRVSSDARRVLMTFDQPQYNHNGGIILFGPDDMLYITLGDGGGGGDRGPGHTPDIGNAQDTTNPLGTILRIDPLGQAGPTPDHGRYAIPADNPFVDDDDVLDVIYAYGLRNVFLMSFDGDTLIGADVGQHHIEIINIIEAGKNYGWNYKEGTFYFDPQADAGQNVFAEPLPHRPVPSGLVDPIAEYDHDEGICIMGGFVYRGDVVEALQGLYVFGDWMRTNVPGRSESYGRLFVTDVYDGDGVIHALPVGDGDSHIEGFVTGFGMDEDGEIYVFTSDTRGPVGTGRIRKIVPHNP